MNLVEDATTLDLISKNRLELGIGSGYDERSFRAFGVSYENRREATTKKLRDLLHAIEGLPLASNDAIIHPLAPDLRARIWQAIFSDEGARYAATLGTNLLLNRATYGYDEPTDKVQLPWAKTYLDAWRNMPSNNGRKPKIGVSRFIFAAKDRDTAKQILQKGVEQIVNSMIQKGKFPHGLDFEAALTRLHAFIGHPDDISEALSKEKVLPHATEIICQANPGIPAHEETLRSLELIATSIAPSLGWEINTAVGPGGALGRKPLNYIVPQLRRGVILRLRPMGTRPCLA
ncbi:LLM class flavin-dependent oxidoreductase [Acetobacter persici]|uniref:LLM class flavin-dependent oxidoreductase n=1 Tax=Acetobacter persici TaxID=1076596 RepID=UPI001BA7708F|nr:LLM class flavin-dependent oxidoreductase [Acetobacter persici]